jgi:phosphomannomutase/phosphoglucomutase
LGCEVYPLYCEIDGNFPAHLPDPTVVAHLKDLQELVRREALDVGVAFDGDGDRLGVVGPQGEMIWGDQLLVLFAREILKTHAGATIIGEVKCSQNLYDDVARHGGRPLMWKTGHSLIKQKMLEEKALLAGEMSGHLFFADRYFGYDDAIYAAGRLLEQLAATDRTITQLLADLPPTVVTPEIRWDCPDETKFQVVENLKSHLAGKIPFIDLDGVRLNFADGWALVRASNTQPALVLRFEAATAERLQEMQTLVEGLLQGELAALGVG